MKRLVAVDIAVDRNNNRITIDPRESNVASYHASGLLRHALFAPMDDIHLPNLCITRNLETFSPVKQSISLTPRRHRSLAPCTSGHSSFVSRLANPMGEDDHIRDARVAALDLKGPP